MSASIFNITINQGEDFEQEIIIKDEAKLPIDLTGYTYSGQIREKYDSATSVATFSCVLNDQRTNKGSVFLRLSHAQTQAIPCQPSTTANKRPLTEFIYDIEETDPSLKVKRILQGIVSVSPVVTK